MKPSDPAPNTGDPTSSTNRMFENLKYGSEYISQFFDMNVNVQINNRQFATTRTIGYCLESCLATPNCIYIAKDL